MGREDIEFKTTDHVTLRGWFFKPDGDKSEGEKLPCLVMTPGYAVMKEMEVGDFAERFVRELQVSCLVYDHRGFGASDTGVGCPRQEIIPGQQTNDMYDAITYAQLRPDVDAERIGVWGSSYSGGNVLIVAAVDRRVKTVVSQVPVVDGWADFHTIIRPDFIPMLDAQLQAERHERVKGGAPMTMPVVDPDPRAMSALPMADSYAWFTSQAANCPSWRNEVTVRTVFGLREFKPVALAEHVAPTPLLMTVAARDTLCSTPHALAAYERARQPKQLQLLPCGRFDVGSGNLFERNVGVQLEFLKRTLCDVPDGV